MSAAIRASDVWSDQRISRGLFHERFWVLLPALVVCALILFPLGVLSLSWLQPDTHIWAHFVDYQLFRISRNTLTLAVLVAGMTGLLGTVLAWLVAMCEFPGRRLAEWLLVLPLAIPTYVMAFVFLGIMDIGGPVQSVLRGWFGSGQYVFPNPYSTFSVSLVLSLVLYPYVYLLARATFLQQGSGLWEASRALGLTPTQSFLRVAAPVARPAVIAGVSLVVMETLADFGAVAIFNYDTFSTAIYQTWFGLGSLNTAAQLSTVLLGLVATTLLLERMTRKRASFYNTTRRTQVNRFVLRGARRWWAVALVWLVIGVSFIMPVAQLIAWSFNYYELAWNIGFSDAFQHTITLGLMAAVVVLICATSQLLVKQYHRNRLLRALIFTTTLGYALPGTVLAVGVMQAFAHYDAWLNQLLSVSGQQWLMGSIWAMIAAYVVRFDTAAFHTLESGVLKIKPSMVDAARSLGTSMPDIVRRVYIPLMRPSVLVAFLLVGVDVMKELPATLLLRPFGWDTLATRIYQLTSEGEWEQSAPFALALLVVGLIPVIFLIRKSAHELSSEEPELTLMQ